MVSCRDERIILTLPAAPLRRKAVTSILNCILTLSGDDRTRGSLPSDAYEPCSGDGGVMGIGGTGVFGRHTPLEYFQFEPIRPD